MPRNIVRINQIVKKIANSRGVEMKMSKISSPNIRTIIITWLEKVDAPVDISRDRIEEIADLCIDEAYSDNRESTFVKPIDKIVSEIVKEHLNKEAKK